MPIFKTRNPSQDAHEALSRNAPPVPPNPFAEQSRGNTLAPEMVDVRLDQQRRAEAQAQQAQPSRTLADDAIAQLAILLAAVEDQREGRPLSPAATQALGDLSRILMVAQARGVGLSSSWPTGTA
ncbi:MAG: hypothetical protein WB808_03375 [Candidatus Dormiibacterota bacterium]